MGKIPEGLTVAQNGQPSMKGLSALVLVALAVLIIVLLVSSAIKGIKNHRSTKDKRRFYATVSSMWNLASRISKQGKDDTPDMREARASIKRFQTQNKKLRGYDDPRLFDMATELYKLISSYLLTHDDDDVKKRLKAQEQALTSTGLW